MNQSVIGVALNFRESLAAIAQPPVAPVLYLKTPNTLTAPGQTIPCPPGVSRLRMAGTIGLVIGRTACNVKAATACSFISAFTIVNDASVPHQSYFRPALRERCFDHSCSVGPHHPPIQREFEINVLVNNVLRSNARTSSLVRSIPQLLADVTEFLTLQPGDILLIGEPETSPLCLPGDKIRIEIPGLGAIENKVGNPH